MPYRSTAILSPAPSGEVPLHTIALAHDQRHLRRKLLHLDNDDVVMLDLKEAVMLFDGDLLVLEGGGFVAVAALPETLYDIRPRDAQHLIELAWHLGNRHLPAEIRTDRILILRDPVIKAMLEGLGAQVNEITAPFQPMRGAYHSGHGRHDHGVQDHSGHDHGGHGHGDHGHGNHGHRHPHD